MDATTGSTKVPSMGPSAQNVHSFALNAVLVLTSALISLIPPGDVKFPDLEFLFDALHRSLAIREKPSNDIPAAKPKVGDAKPPRTYSCLNYH